MAPRDAEHVRGDGSKMATNKNKSTSRGARKVAKRATTKTGVDGHSTKSPGGAMLARAFNLMTGQELETLETSEEDFAHTVREFLLDLESPGPFDADARSRFPGTRFEPLLGDNEFLEWAQKGGPLPSAVSDRIKCIYAAVLERDGRRVCRVCLSTWQPQQPQKAKGGADFDASGALNRLREMEHANHDADEKRRAAQEAYLELDFYASSPTTTDLARCEDVLRSGGFTGAEIAASNLDGGAAEQSHDRVANRQRLALMLRRAEEAADLARSLQWSSSDPSCDAAIRVVRLALLSMAGVRGAGLPPLDCLTELRQKLKDAADAEAGGEADKRRLMAIIRWVISYVTDHGSSQKEARVLLRKLKAFSVAFADLTESDCADILGRFVAHELVENGVAAELVVTAGAWGYVRDDNNPRGRRAFLQDLNKALKRGK